MIGYMGVYIFVVLVAKVLNQITFRSGSIFYIFTLLLSNQISYQIFPYFPTNSFTFNIFNATVKHKWNKLFHLNRCAYIDILDMFNLLTKIDKTIKMLDLFEFDFND